MTKRVGRPPKLFTCETCKKVMGTAEVRTHKCAPLQLSAK